MLNEQDEQILRKLLQTQDLPDDVVAECEMRERWFHSCGAGGGIGPLALIDLLRFLGYKRKPTVQPPVPVDWNRMLADGSLRVEARFDVKATDWHPGIYLGVITAGTLAVLLDDRERVLEFARVNVRLPDTLSVAAEPKPEPVQEPEPEPEPASVDDTIELPASPVYYANQMVTVLTDAGLLPAIVRKVDGGEVVVVVRGEEGERRVPLADVEAL